MDLFIIGTALDHLTFSLDKYNKLKYEVHEHRQRVADQFSLEETSQTHTNAQTQALKMQK